MPRRPIVAVTATFRLVENVAHVQLADSYVRALEGAGLVPLIVPPLADPADADRVLDAADGLLLSGGEDVDPTYYGAAPHPALGPLNRLRDASELALARAARARGTPTLAICRGLQVLNVALGGSLVQDIPSERAGSLDHDPQGGHRFRAHPVTVAAGTLLARIVGVGRLAANSLHHQALDRVAPALRVAAEAPDGIVEAAESAHPDWWALGVQWHPEELIATPEPWDRALFEAFAARCLA